MYVCARARVSTNAHGGQRHRTLEVIVGCEPLNMSAGLELSSSEEQFMLLALSPALSHLSSLNCRFFCGTSSWKQSLTV